MTEVLHEQSRSQFYVHTECCCCRRCWCCCSVCRYTIIAAAATVLLLPAAVRHRVPDGQICCWIIESDPSVSFLFIQRDLFLVVPLGSTVSHLRPRFAYILGNCGHARSQGGRQPAAAKPPLYAYFRIARTKNTTPERGAYRKQLIPPDKILDKQENTRITPNSPVC